LQNSTLNGNATGNSMMRPLQPPPSWYRQFWYAKHSPLDRLVDRVLFFAIAVLALLAGISLLAR
jgi:hypothetical protein